MLRAGLLDQRSQFNGYDHGDCSEAMCLVMFDFSGDGVTEEADCL